MPLSVIYDPKHWRDRADEARAVAKQMNDPDDRGAMLQIADDYERLAERAKERTASAQRVEKKPLE